MIGRMLRNGKTSSSESFCSPSPPITTQQIPIRLWNKRNAFLLKWSLGETSEMSENNPFHFHFIFIWTEISANHANCCMSGKNYLEMHDVKKNTFTSWRKKKRESIFFLLDFPRFSSHCWEEWGERRLPKNWQFDGGRQWHWSDTN